MDAASEERRVALVIGNADYDNAVPLDNPLNDARVVAETLKKLGFELITVDGRADYNTNLCLVSMLRVLADFSVAAETAETAIVYFAGHGVEIDGQNYLLPKDARLSHVRHVYYETIKLDNVRIAIERAMGLRLILLDACRDDPFKVPMRGLEGRSVGRGLANIEPSGNTGIAYAAKHGTTAHDGPFGDNSPFAKALVKHLPTPDLEIRLLFGRVRDEVMSITSFKQEPHFYSNFGGKELYLIRAHPTPPSETRKFSASASDSHGAVPKVVQQAQALWSEFRIEETEDPELIKAYIRQVKKDVPLQVYKAQQRLKEVEAVLGQRQCAKWEEACEENSENAYEEYVRLWPQGIYVGDARARIAAIREDSRWKAAVTSGTLDTFYNYCRDFPAGRFESEAFKKIRELEEVEARDREQKRVQDLILPQAVITSLKASNKEHTFQELSVVASRLTGISEHHILNTLLARERLGSTGIGNGIAIPHVALKELNRLVTLFARLEEPVGFDAIDGKPVDIIFLVLVPLTGANRLTNLARISRLIRQRGVVERLRSAQNKDTICTILSGKSAELKEVELHGKGVSSGFASGPIVLIGETDSKRTKSSDPEREKSDFNAAVQAAAAELSELSKRSQSEAKYIVDFQLSLLRDDVFLALVLAAIDLGEAADCAWRALFDAEIDEYDSAGYEHFRARAVDLRDVRDRVLARLTGITADAEIPAGAILLGNDLAPSRFLATDWSRGGAIVLSRGSEMGHVALLARSWRVPMIVGVGVDFNGVSGEAIVDAGAGAAVLNPSQAMLTSFSFRRAAQHRAASTASQLLKSPATTKDGTHIHIQLNIASIDELTMLDPAMCEGIGLVRTEFLFRDLKLLPDEEEQYEAYRRIVQWAAGRPVTIRAFDGGGDKQIPGVVCDDESNSHLGVRGIRLLLAHTEVFRQQLRALIRAAVHGRVKILLPMVTTPLEVEVARGILEEERCALSQRQLGIQRPSLGIMVEVPAAALALDFFDVDFLSIGSNDLIQYLTAAARNNGAVTSLANPLHPGVIRMIADIARFGRDKGIEVNLCGDAAGDPVLLPHLLQAGLRSLSMAPHAVAEAKATIAGINLENISHTYDPGSKAGEAARILAKAK